MPFHRCLTRKINIFKPPFIIKNYQQQCHLNNINHHCCVNYKISQESKHFVKLFSTIESNPKKNKTENVAVEEEPKPGLIKRFKQMYRDYWYVLVPVHLVTSAGWFGGFYYLAKSGVDIAAVLQTMGFSEKFTNPLKDSSMGYLAISYALYKIATPVRYTVTLGGTTISINYLKELGYIKPVPSKDKLKEMYKERRDHLRETIQETKEELRQRKDQLKERKDNIVGDYIHFKKELKDIKTKNIQKVVSHIKQK